MCEEAPSADSQSPKPPVPGRARQRWTRGYQFFHPFKVKVRDQDRLPHQFRRLRGENILDGQRNVSIALAFKSKASQQPADRSHWKNGSRKLQNVAPRMSTDHRNFLSGTS
jgi:hypothetical protein